MNLLVTAAAGVLIAAAAGMAGYGKGYLAGKNEVQQAWDKEKAAQMAEYAAAQEAARKREQELQASADAIRKEKDAKIRDINARSAALVNSLRQRPERTESSKVSDSAGTCSGTTGAQLARPDGEFLAGYAADAAKLQVALDQCVKQYNEIRKGNHGN